MLPKITLHTTNRQIIGKKVNVLRRQGWLPGNIYGHNIPSQAVSIKLKDFLDVYAKAKETALIDLQVEDGQVRPVLIHGVQQHPLTDQPLHVDFYQVNLTERVRVNVHVEVTGQAPAQERNEGVLLTELSEIEVEALPTELPDKISVDVGNLESVGDTIYVKNLTVPNGVTILSDPELIVVHLVGLVKEEEVAPSGVEGVAEQIGEAEQQVSTSEQSQQGHS